MPFFEVTYYRQVFGEPMVLYIEAEDEDGAYYQAAGHVPLANGYGIRAVGQGTYDAEHADWESRQARAPQEPEGGA